MTTLWTSLQQSFLLPTPSLTESNLPSQSGRVFIVTGGYTGLGLELVKILYRHHGTIYIAGRSSTKASSAIAAVKAQYPSSDGRLAFLPLDLDDLTTIAPAAASFLSQESRLDVLTLNAGVMSPPPGSRTTQGHELQLGTNCLGHFLLAQLLLPVLRKTAATAPPGSVRVTWAASLGVDVYSPSEGILFDDRGAPIVHKNQRANYGVSKVGNYFYAAEFARRYPYAETGIVTNAWNPGNLRSELQRYGGWVEKIAGKCLLYETRFGAYTELWAGWSEEAGKAERNGAYIWPWGRFGGVRGDVERAVVEGGAARFWEWSEEQVKPYT
ncbi:short-chain alcohol dehydrogenase [Zalaria obscura]|uniref:Short-chain alcohol dehydrogenase n=1 Tax=Zalaria obscura TaxID=2024903 RepID=A0ACC3S4I4_9PEZI